MVDYVRAYVRAPNAETCGPCRQIHRRRLG
jgi:hypothetical protein